VASAKIGRRRERCPRRCARVTSRSCISRVGAAVRVHRPLYPALLKGTARGMHQLLHAPAQCILACGRRTLTVYCVLAVAPDAVGGQYWGAATAAACLLVICSFLVVHARMRTHFFPERPWPAISTEPRTPQYMIPSGSTRVFRTSGGCGAVFGSGLHLSGFCTFTTIPHFRLAFAEPA